MKYKILVALFVLLFSTMSMAGVACLPEMDYGDPSGAKQSGIESAYKKQEDPKADLMGCFMDATMRGVSKAKASCPCENAIKKLCKFDDGEVEWHDPGVPKSWCLMFL